MVGNNVSDDQIRGLRDHAYVSLTMSGIVHAYLCFDISMECCNRPILAPGQFV